MGIKNIKHENQHQQTTEKKPKNYRIKEYVRYIAEFRARLLWLVGSIIVAAVIGFEFKDIIQGLMTMQLVDLSLINLQPAADGPSTVQMTVLAAVIAGLPLVTYHAYRFFEPLLGRGDTYAIKMFGSSILLVFAAIAYSFIVSIPLGLHGMVAYGQDVSIAHFSTQIFLNIAFSNVVVILVLFQLPLAIILANGIDPFGTKTFRGLQAIVVPVIFVAAWIATQFTTFNREIAGILSVVVPVIILFEISIFWARKHTKILPAVQTPLLENAEEQPLTQQLQAPVPQVQPARQTAAPAFIAPKTVLETEAVPSFPDEMFDGLFDDKSDARPAVPQPVTRQPMTASVSAARPVMRPQTAPVQAPRFAATPQKPTMSSIVVRPQAMTAPQPASQQIKPSFHARPAMPMARSMVAPRQTIPFGMSPAPSYRKATDGMLPA